MKKMLMAACAVLMLASCGKEEAAESSATRSLKTTGYRVFDGEICSGDNGNCLPEATVDGNAKKAIAHVFGVIDTGNQPDIKVAFNQNQTILSRYLSSKILAAVAAQTVEVSSTDGSSGGSIHYMVFSTTGNSGDVAVYPFLD